MITPPKIYLKRTDVPIESLYDMEWEDSKQIQASVVQNGKTTIDTDFRSTTLKIGIDPLEYPDVCTKLIEMVNIWDSTLNPANFVVKEFNYLKYGKGDKFKRHKDANDSGRRVFSTSTVIKTSEDLDGGEFKIWDDYGLDHTVNLIPGETIFFDSTRHHEVTEVIQGNREVLVAWIYYK